MTTPTKTRKATTAKATAKERRLANLIATACFTDGTGERAYRLVMQRDALDIRIITHVQGWALEPMADHIARVLAAARHSTKGKRR